MNAYLLSLLIIVSNLSYILAWSWVNHGKPPVDTGMAFMMGGNNPKLFGVGEGRLQERIWTGSQWAWVNHGAPWWLNTGERLESTPCVLKDGKVFVITNRGRLVERVWNNGWHWAHHGKPPGLNSIRTTGCTCTTAHAHRVFVVGIDFKLYERYWSSSSNSWLWRPRGSPQGLNIGFTGIDSCNRASCTTTLVYTAASNGNLYRLLITPSNPFAGIWQDMGRPAGENVRSVAVANFGNRVFITTYDNDICEFVGLFNSYYCFGKPSGVGNTATTSISKPVDVNNCNKLPGISRYVFIYSWDPSYHRRSRFFKLRVFGTASSSWTYHGSIGALGQSYRESPESFLSGGCPKVFTTRSSGYVYEFFI